MNHVSVEEIEEQPDAVVGKFLINAFTTLILFDTGASHSFISRGFVDKFKLPIVALKSLMTHKYRGSIILLSISKSVEPNEEQKEMIRGFQQGILFKY